MANTNAPTGFSQNNGVASQTYEMVQVAIASTNTSPIFAGDPVAQLSTGYIGALPVSGTSITVTGASGTGAVATLTYSSIAAANVPPVGSTVVVSGLTSTGVGYNGIWTVTASSQTSLSYASAATGTYVAGGTIVGYVPILGVFVCCEYLSTSQKKKVWNNYWPGADAAADVTAWIISDPDAVYSVQTANSNTTATAVGLANIGQNINFSYGSGGNTASGLSGAYADQYTIATSPYLPFRIIGLANYTPGGVTPFLSISGNDYTSAYNKILVRANYAVQNTLFGI